MQVGLLIDPRFEQHDTGAGHPERPGRLAAIREALEPHRDRFTAIGARPVEDSLLTAIHDAQYLQRVRLACERGADHIDEPDCRINQSSFEIARLAAGGVIEAARKIGGGELARAFCAVRPPGHHAERDRAMGFCLLANVSLAAHAFRTEFGYDRVAILDWDVHHGNGTQHVFEADPHVLFVSLHGHPATLYPGTGYASEIGIGPGKGFTVNIPLAPRTPEPEYRSEFEAKALTAIDRFKPQALILSAGFDAHRYDPLGNQLLTDETYDWMLERVIELANAHASGRVLSVLEGGYDLGVLDRCVPAHALGLLKP